MGADSERRNQQYETIDRYPARKKSPRPVVVVESKREKYGRAADRIHDREQSADH